MTVSFGQTDTASPFGMIAAGSGLTVPASGTATCEATPGATAGTASHTVTVANSSTGQACIGIEAMPDAGTTWAAGDWSVPLDVTANSSGANITLTDVYLQHVDGTGALVASLAHATPNQAMGTNQTYLLSVTGAAGVAAPGASDTVYIVLGFSSSKTHGGAASITVVFDPAVASPFTSGGGGTPVSSADTASGAEGSVPEIGLAKPDTGHAAEASSIHATLASPDTAHAAETAIIKVSGADTGHAVESASLQVTLASPDTAHAAESGSVNTGGTPVSGADSASGAEHAPAQVTLAAAGSWADTANAVESAHLGVSSADAARGKEAAYNFGGDWAYATESASVSTGGTQNISGSDTSSAAESATLHVTLTGLDTAHAVESAAGQTRVGLKGAESASAGQGVPSTHATLSGGPDSALAAEQRPSVRLAGAGTADHGSGAEAGTVHAALSGVESASAGQGVPVTRPQGAGTADSALSSAQTAIHATLSGTDLVTGAEGALRAGITGPDAAGSLEASSIHATLSGVDTGHAADVGVSPSGSNPAGADTVHAAETGTVHADLSGSDTGHGAEGSSLQVALSSADSAHAAESASIGVSAADDTNAAETQKITADVSAADSTNVSSTAELRTASSDSASATEASTIAATVSGAGTADSVHAAETGTTPGSSTPVSSADTALATESAFYGIHSSDTASATDLLVASSTGSSDFVVSADRPRNAWPGSGGTARDFAAATDQSMNAWPASKDAGAATEAHGPFPVPATGALADEAVALEVTHEIGIWTYIPVNVRLEGRFWRITGTDEHGNEVVVLEAERLSRAELELAERVARGPVRKIAADDCCQARDAVTRTPVGVTVWVEPAVRVAVSIAAVPVAPVPVAPVPVLEAAR